MKKLLANDDGATLVEYAILLCLVAGIAIAGLKSLGNSIDTTMAQTASVLAANSFSTGGGSTDASGNQGSSSGSDSGSSSGSGGNIGNGQGNGNGNGTGESGNNGHGHNGKG